MKKKSIFSSVLVGIAMLAFTFCLVSFVSNTLGWVVPATDAAVKNPVKSTAASIAAGKEEYIKSCKSCHGEKGNSKMALPSDFTSAAFKGQSDGAVFYKINTGFGKMPKYKTKIAADNDRWNLVNYMRTL